MVGMAANFRSSCKVRFELATTLENQTSHSFIAENNSPALERIHDDLEFISGRNSKTYEKSTEKRWRHLSKIVQAISIETSLLRVHSALKDNW